MFITKAAYQLIWLSLSLWDTCTCILCLNIVKQALCLQTIFAFNVYVQWLIWDTLKVSLGYFFSIFFLR